MEDPLGSVNSTCLLTCECIASSVGVTGCSERWATWTHISWGRPLLKAQALDAVALGFQACPGYPPCLDCLV